MEEGVEVRASDEEEATAGFELELSDFADDEETCCELVEEVSCLELDCI